MNNIEEKLRDELKDFDVDPDAVIAEFEMVEDLDNELEFPLRYDHYYNDYLTKEAQHRILEFFDGQEPGFEM